MHRIVVREKVATFGFGYALLDREDYAYLEGLMAGKAEFAFGYVGSDGQTHTVTAYCSKTSIVLKSRKRPLQELPVQHHSVLREQEGDRGQCPCLFGRCSLPLCGVQGALLPGRRPPR